MIPPPADIKSSAQSLLAGQVLAVLGYGVIALGGRIAYKESLSPWGDPDAGVGLIAFGGFLILACLIMTTIGLYQLASNTDTAARGAAISVQALERLGGRIEALHAAQAATRVHANVDQLVESTEPPPRHRPVTDASSASEPGLFSPAVSVTPHSQSVTLPDAPVNESLGVTLARLRALHEDGTISAEQYAIEKTLALRKWTSRG